MTRVQTTVGRLVGAWLLAAVALPLGVASAADPPLPDADPFYRAPAALADLAPGAVIRSREVEVTVAGAPLSSFDAKAYQLLYRTSDPSGEPVANVTTALVPDGARPSGGRDLVSFQDAEDSLTTNCAPSYQLRVGERDNSSLMTEVPASVPTQVGAGRVLVFPDQYGPRSEFLVTTTEARATLDSIRAVEHFDAAQVDGARTPVALVGYSGGGHETAAAAERQPRYAPELNVVGAAAGGTPAGDRTTYDYLDGREGSGIVMGALIALERAHPAIGWTALLNAYGRTVSDRAQHGPGCVDPVVSGTDRFQAWSDGPDPLAVPRIARAIAANALGHHAPTAPTYLYISQHDQLVSLTASDRLATLYCAQGTRLDYVRDQMTYPAPLDDHLESALSGFLPQALSYLNDRFDGKTPPTTCPAAAAASPRCRLPRVVRVRTHIPHSLRVRSIRVTVRGRRVRFVHHRARALRVHVPRAARTRTLRVLVKVSGRRHGHAVTLRRRHVFRPCAHGPRA